MVNMDIYINVHTNEVITSEDYNKMLHDEAAEILMTYHRPTPYTVEETVKMLAKLEVDWWKVSTSNKTITKGSKVYYNGK